MPKNAKINHQRTLEYIKLMAVVFVFLLYGCAKKITFTDKGAELHNAPDKAGIFFIAGSGYILINEGKFLNIHKEYPLTRKELAVESIIKADGEFTLIKKAENMKFLNRSSIGIKLVKLNADKVILVRKTYMSGCRDEAKYILCKTEKIGEDVNLITVSLETGEYAFVNTDPYLELGIGEAIIEPIFLFKVIDK